MPNERCKCALLGCAAVLGFASVAGWAQSASTGTISGQVTDQQGAAIGGAEIRITDVSTNIAQKTVSNDAGRYIFVNVAPGTYNITVSKTGFTTFNVGAQKVD